MPHASIYNRQMSYKQGLRSVYNCQMADKQGVKNEATREGVLSIIFNFSVLIVIGLRWR